MKNNLEKYEIFYSLAKIKLLFVFKKIYLIENQLLLHRLHAEFI